MKQRVRARRRLRFRYLKRALAAYAGILLGAFIGAIIGLALLLTSPFATAYACGGVCLAALLGGMFGHATSQILRKMEPETNEDAFEDVLEHFSPVEEVKPMLSMNPKARVRAVKVQPGEDLLEVLRRAQPRHTDEPAVSQHIAPPILHDEPLSKNPA